MRQLLLLILSLVTITSTAQTYNVDFDQVTWTANGSGISTSGNTATIEGSSTQYRYYQHTVTVDPNISDLYFTAKIHLENIQTGSAGWDTPKIRMESTTGSKLINYNISSSIEGQWVHVGVEISNFKSLGLSEVVLKFGMQNTSGTMKITEPLLSSEKMTGDYIFPYPIPADPSVTLDVNTSEYHTFQNDLLSTNCHFTWAPYNWEDNNVKEMIYKKFPMQNLRFPGGTVANFYNWQTDDFYDNAYSDKNNTAKTGAQDDKKFGYNGYADVTKTLGGNSTLLFNVFSDDKSLSQQRLLDRLEDNLDIKWIEMGNENYFGDQAYGFVDDRETTINGNNDGDFYDEYINHTKQLASWLKEIKPDIKVAVNTHDEEWNAPLAQEDYYDACVMHNYIFNNSFMMNQYAVTQYMGAYRTTQNRLSTFKETFGDKPVIMSEWGLLAEFPNSFLQVICSADNFLSIEKGNHDGIVEQAGIHMLYHGDFIGEGSLIMHDGKELRLNPIGVMYSKLFEVFKNNKVYNAYSSSSELETNLDAVHAKAIDVNDSVYVFVVNKLPVSSPLNLSFDGEKYNGEFSIETYTEDITSILKHNYAIDENPWKRETSSGEIAVPPYSISVITIQKSDFQNICNAPNIGGNTSLCGLENVELNTNLSSTNRSFTWYKDGETVENAISSALTVAEAGTYTVIADSLGCIREDEIIVSDELETIYLGNDDVLCTSASKILRVALNNPAVSYTWTKDGIELAETSDMLQVYAAGSYSVTAQADGCISVSDQININSWLTDVLFDTICSEGEVNLKIKETGEFAWYGSEDGGDVLSNDLIYTPTISENTTFYVQDNTIDAYTTGLSAPTGTVYGGTTDYTIWGRKMYLKVDKDFQLDAVDVFTNSETDIILTISGTGGTFEYIENGIPETGKTTPHTLKANFSIPAGDYTINLIGTTGKVFVQVSDKTDNTIDGILEFGGLDGGTHYGFLYNWNISIPNTCIRTPVKAIIDPFHSDCDQSTEQTISLKYGWNLVSFNIHPLTPSVADIFPHATIVKTFNTFWSSDQDPFLNSLTEIKAGEGYLVYNTVAETISAQGTIIKTGETVNLQAGWNLVGVPATSSIPVAELPADIEIIKDFESYYELGDKLNSLSELLLGKAYFIKAKAVSSITFE